MKYSQQRAAARKRAKEVAAGGLAGPADRGAVSVLSEGLEDPKEALALECAESLRSFGASAAPTIPSLMRFIGSPLRSRHARQRALEVLADIQQAHIEQAYTYDVFPTTTGSADIDWDE